MGRKRGLPLDGERLRDLRLSLGLTQDDVASGARITTRTYQNAELGKPVSAKIGIRISAVLGEP